MTKKQTLNLTGSVFAGVQAIADEFKRVQHCKLVSSREIVGSVKEIVFQVTTPETTAEVAVWVIANGDKTYRNLFIYQKKENEMSSFKFNPTTIEYGNEEEARKFAPKNAAVCERLNNGEKFAFLCSEWGEFSGDEFNPYYSFIVMMDETLIPLPVFLAAADVDSVPFDWYETTEEEVDAYLRETFGDQYTTYVEDREDVRTRQLVQISESGDVEVVTEFNIWNKPESAQSVPEYNANLFNHLVDETRVNYKWLKGKVAQSATPKHLVLVQKSTRHTEYDLKSIKDAFRS